MAKENRKNDYRLESVRLRSFQNWPVSILVSPEKLAQAGFYYLGKGDKVRCFSCNIAICEWVEGDNPQSEHRRWSPGCQFMINQRRGNTVMSTACAMTPPYFYGKDVCGADDSLPTCSGTRQFVKSAFDVEKLLSLGLMLNRRPVHPDFATLHSRVSTFKNWLPETKVTKEQLAEAGFFYLQCGDWLCCYHCNICLRGWQMVDDPWKEHAKWSSKCYFILMRRGVSFINEATGVCAAMPLTCEVCMSCVVCAN